MPKPSTDIESILQFLDETLGIPGFPDDPRAQNGLQIEGGEQVWHVGAAVDASVEVMEAAEARDVNLLLVHHGLFWEGLRPLTGRAYRRVAPALRSGMAVYSAHLPLDGHPELGNAALLIRALDLEPTEPFGTYEGADIGFATRTDEPREALRGRVSGVLGGPVRLIPGGPDRVSTLGVVTGGGGSFIEGTAEAGLSTLLTGEGPHYTYAQAMELGVNVLYAGHYATETFGVRALAQRVAKQFNLTWEFLDFPSGL